VTSVTNMGEPVGRPGRSAGVGLLITLSLPGLVCLLVAVAAVEAFGRRVLGRRGRTASGVGVEELEAFFSARKRAEVQERAGHSLVRDEVGNGAPPPWLRIDPATGEMTVVRDQEA
jgi:hypothetical protein